MPNSRFQNALNRIPQETPPIWFMRQAGRYHDHYQNLKKSYSFVQLCKNPALSAQTALGPIEEFDFDVAILFSDILFPLESLGMDLKYDPGPIFKEHLLEENTSRILSNKNPISSLEFQGEAIERTLELLPENKSMIGFVGGPWTLLSFASAKNKLEKSEKLESYQWAILEEHIYPLLHKNISLQLNAGAELVMIFDSCAHQLVQDDLLIYLNKILNELVKSFPNQVGYYAKDGVSYDHIFAATDSSEVPFAGIGVDSNVSIKDIFSKRKDGFIQGNFSEKIITQDFNEFDKALSLFLEDISSLSIEDRKGWVCGLGHGVIKTTPQENVKHFVKKVRSYL
tara:strand:+ start:2032 stop:3051 length:1020 start_codon:yes stop_codon:yes gene_type:complete